MTIYRNFAKFAHNIRKIFGRTNGQTPFVPAGTPIVVRRGTLIRETTPCGPLFRPSRCDLRVVVSKDSCEVEREIRWVGRGGYNRYVAKEAVGLA